MFMYCNFTKSHVFPLVSRASSCNPKCFNHLSNGFCWGILQNSRGAKSRNSSIGSRHIPLCDSCGSKSRNFPCGFSLKSLEGCSGMKSRYFSSKFQAKSSENVGPTRARRFSDGSHLKAMDNSGGAKPRKALPWIASYRSKESKGSGKPAAVKTSGSSWEESANIYFSKNSTSPSFESSESSTKTLKKNRESSSSWEDSANIHFSNTSTNHAVEKKDSGTKPSLGSRDPRTIDVPSFKADEEEEVEEDVEPVDDPRWDKIKSKYQRIIETRSRKPESRRWDKQESWGRKTWKEATESTVPKLIGEGIYGVGPVLAALTVGKREFYTLYVQEGLDFGNNNRKKKDKKGFERALKRAEKMGLTVKETSKHDLNMVVDNRPHQGLVLDASPLEMDCISELDPVPTEEDKSTVWVALDEVTDPQNLGAILRSAYFFGAAGVVLCAKNSAPLSGVVSKASAGSLELIELRCCKNMMQFLTKSIENGWRVLGGSVSSRALPLNEVAAGAPTILVLGSEGSGLRPLVEKSCSQLIRIPGNIPLGALVRGIEGEEIRETDDSSSSTEEFRSFMAVESLNVSVAAGVLLYHLVGISKCSTGKRQIDAVD